MKKNKLFLILFLLNTIITLSAQIQFEEHIIIDNTVLPDQVRSIHVADIDGDGDIDILSASRGDDKIAWYENTDGLGNFGRQQVISLNADRANSVYASDIDGDGDLDVLSASIDDDKIAWYENLNELGGFGEQQIISTNTDAASSVFAVDVDGDGDMDVLSASISDNKIAWYENTDGLGNFGEEQIISTNADGAISIFASDIDGDGDMDVLSASFNDDKIAWYENNDGLGNFGEQQIISINADGAMSVITSDLDGDGDMDVLSASRDDNKIAWYENTDGMGNFGTQQSIALDAADAWSVFATDIDGDGDIDVLSASLSDDKIAWYENIDGLGNFNTQQVISIDADGAISVYSADIDGDGDMDVLSASWNDDKIAWYNNTDGFGNFETQQYINENSAQAISVHATDIDNDGDIDVLSASIFDDKIAWYENLDGLGNFGSQQTITLNTDGARSVYATDIDGDGDMDVLSASQYDDKIAWYENTDGLGSFDEQQIISINADWAISVYSSDLDGDGDMDVLSASSQDDKVAWYENLDGLGNFGSEQIITINTDEVWSVFATDVDGSGRIDVLSASRNDNKIAWYQNTDGLGNFGNEQIISQNFGGANSIYSTDVDGDGDMDVLSAVSTGDVIAWYENLDGMGNFGSQQILTTDADGAKSVYSTDVDGDGDVDVLSASSVDNKVGWYENLDGLGNFKTQHIITQNAEGANSVYASDIDGDGDMDVLSSSFEDGKIAWYENISIVGTKSVSILSDLDFNVYPNPTSSILFIDTEANIVEIEIFNNLSQVLLGSSNDKSIDISTLPQGLYFCKVNDIHGNYGIHKVVKQ